MNLLNVILALLCLLCFANASDAQIFPRLPGVQLALNPAGKND